MDRNAPSRIVLLTNEEDSKSILRCSMLNVDNLLSLNDDDQIRHGIQCLKERNKLFSDSSRALSKWFMNHGSPERSNEVRHERYVLHEEVVECITALNNRLSSLSVEQESNLGDCSSVISIQIDAPVEQNLSNLVDLDENVSERSLDEMSNKDIAEGRDLDLLGVKMQNVSLGTPAPPGLHSVNTSHAQNLIPLPLPASISGAEHNFLSSNFPQMNSVAKVEMMYGVPQNIRPVVTHDDPIMSTNHHRQPFSNNFAQPIYSMQQAIPPQIDPMLNHIYVPHQNVDPFAHSNPIEYSVNSNVCNQTNVVSSHNAPCHNAPRPVIGQPPQCSIQHAPRSLNDTARQFLKMDIMKGLNDPFNGDCKKFWSWHDFINSRINEAGIDGIEILHALKANTKGRPQMLISNYLDAGVHDPGRVANDIWSTFRRRYGSNDQVSSTLRDNVRNFSKIDSEYDIDGMEDLYGLGMVIETNASRCDSLKYYLLPEGMKEIWKKMPSSFIKKWQNFYCNKQESGVSPSFKDLMSEMLKFINNRSNPMFMNEFPIKKMQRTRVLKTNSQTVDRSKVQPKLYCSFHDKSTHSLVTCEGFNMLSLDDRRSHAFEHKLCFRCLGGHRANVCKSKSKCDLCNGSHVTVMHRDRPVNNDSMYQSKGYENKKGYENRKKVQNLCTAVCKNGLEFKVCSKTVPVELRLTGQQHVIKCLAIIDEQSNNTFVDEKIVKLLKVPSSNIEKNQYTLTTLEQLKSTVDGSIIAGLEVKGVRKPNWIKLPPSLTHSSLPDTSDEAADPSIVRKHGHIKRFADKFPVVDSQLEVLLLVGTNCGEAMRTRCYGNTVPFVHDTALGFALVGSACLNASSDPSKARVLRTAAQDCEHFSATRTPYEKKRCEPSCQTDVFIERPDDEFYGPSKEDEDFLRIVSEGIIINKYYYIEIPLPFKRNFVLPNNYSAVFKRSRNTLLRIAKDTVKTDKCVDIMDKYLKCGHVEELLDDVDNSKRNFIPVFLVENKSGKLRLVFDSSAKYHGTSLNDCLLQGPDENNRLIGVLMRFRHEEVAVSADIECMFHSFYVPPDQRDFQCFFWWKGNDPSNGLSVFRANVHVFGNTSSPSIATYGLRYTTRVGEAKKYPSACELIMNNFYVDDALGSKSTVNEAIAVLKNTRTILSNYNIRLHKIISSHPMVLQAFPPSEIAANVDSVDLNQSSAQHALGITWVIGTDEFQLKCNIKPNTQFTKRTVLSVNGSLFDPLGIASPVGLTGKLLQRQIFSASDRSNVQKRDDWDDPLPEEYAAEWSKWIALLDDIHHVKLPRCYHSSDFSVVERNELHVFCDASKDSIGHVIYLRQVDEFNNVSVSFVIGSSKVAPRAATTIPRLELCAAVGAAQAAQYVKTELKKTINLIKYYSDSNIVLGYLNNRVRRFTRYVTSRVQSILSVCSADQWRYVSTESNPGDIATRPHSPKQLMDTPWLNGPDFLWSLKPVSEKYREDLDVELPETATEARVLQCTKTEENYVLSRLLKFSNWKMMYNVATHVILFKERLKSRDLTKTEARELAIHFIVREMQQSSFCEAYCHLKNGTVVPVNNDMSPLNPFLDVDGLMRVGGRLNHGDLPYKEKHPVLLPHNHPITQVILRHYHELSHHQGRHLTVASMRHAGLHIHKPRSIISSLLKNCITCKKIRGKLQTQQMAPLPPDRLEKTAPFEKTGMDVFGPFTIYDGKSTRRTTASKKVWVLLFTCLYSRGVHLECLNSLDTPTFIMAFRRFVAIRGKCTLLRSDHGTNFMGAKNELGGDLDVQGIKSGIENVGCQWELVPPYASHFAGVWERKVGSVKNVLNVAISQSKQTFLSRDEFHTLLQEAGSIVNNTPFAEISCDPTEPLPVSPANLLTHREGTPANEESYSPEDLLHYGKKRWRRCQYLADQFWVRWKRDYLTSLQERNKWKFPGRNMCEGDVVLVRCPAPRNQWPLGLIAKVHPGIDGLVRRVVIRLKPSERGSARYAERAIHDLVLLVPSSQHSAS